MVKGEDKLSNVVVVRLGLMEFVCGLVIFLSTQPCVPSSHCCSLSQQQSPVSAQISSHQHPPSPLDPHLPAHVPAIQWDKLGNMLGKLGCSVTFLLTQPRGVRSQSSSLSQQQSFLSSHKSLHQQSSTEPPPQRPEQLPDLLQVGTARLGTALGVTKRSVKVGRWVTGLVEDT